MQIIIRLINRTEQRREFWLFYFTVYVLGLGATLKCYPNFGLFPVIFLLPLPQLPCVCVDWNPMNPEIGQMIKLDMDRTEEGGLENMVQLPL